MCSSKWVCQKLVWLQRHLLFGEEIVYLNRSGMLDVCVSVTELGGQFGGGEWRGFLRPIKLTNQDEKPDKVCSSEVSLFDLHFSGSSCLWTHMHVHFMMKKDGHNHASPLSSFRTANHSWVDEGVFGCLKMRTQLFRVSPCSHNWMAVGTGRKLGKIRNWELNLSRSVSVN